MEGRCLNELGIKESARVRALSGESDMLRRLQDMGLVKGTRVTCVGESPLGDPKAYLIRGAVIGLRAKDSREVWIEEEKGGKECKEEKDKGIKREPRKVIALAGNPNVGKSTVFNQLTGMRQHTGNWIGKTVCNAKGYCTYESREYEIIDIPGCYSLMPRSAEEEIARDVICFEQPDTVVVVCDASCLERNLNLVLQIMEVTRRVIVCVNMMDEAEKKQIQIKQKELSHRLGVPVIGTAARDKKGLEQIFSKASQVCSEEDEAAERCLQRQFQQKEPIVTYPGYIEEAVSMLAPAVEACCERYGISQNIRWLSLRLLDGSDSLWTAMKEQYKADIRRERKIQDAVKEIKKLWEGQGITEQSYRDDMAEASVKKAEEVCRDTVIFKTKSYAFRDRKMDWLFTSRATGFPIMFAVLLGIFWITITGANYPSAFLNHHLMKLEGYLAAGCVWLHIPEVVYEPMVYGVYRVLAWVVSVMLPPMAIFFPLFTLLEDFGYLPRVAFNLDKCFQKCNACGKQALTMAMGFGCNAAAVTGCRIIDSPRERLIAMITNNFVPCNGRFPTLIAIITMFFVGTAKGAGASFLSALLLAGTILIGVFMTFLISRILSGTILKGVPSSFTLELPPYRRPQIVKVIVRSVFDRTLFVLGRAVIVAAPAGLLIWILANVKAGDLTLLTHLTNALHPFGRALGMDGVILMAFILGFPANEIVVPLMIMAYMSNGTLVEFTNLAALKDLLTANGWTVTTAVCTMLFALMHWPCSTTCLTIRKESGSVRWTAAAFLIPAVTGMAVCFITASIMRFFF